MSGPLGKVTSNLLWLRVGTVSATIGDTKMAEEYFQDVVNKARKKGSEHLAHFLINYGLVNIQMVRKLFF